MNEILSELFNQIIQSTDNRITEATIVNGQLHFRFNNVVLRLTKTSNIEGSLGYINVFSYYEPREEYQSIEGFFIKVISAGQPRVYITNFLDLTAFRFPVTVLGDGTIDISQGDFCLQFLNQLYAKMLTEPARQWPM